MAFSNAGRVLGSLVRSSSTSNYYNGFTTSLIAWTTASFVSVSTYNVSQQQNDKVNDKYYGWNYPSSAVLCEPIVQSKHKSLDSSNANTLAIRKRMTAIGHFSMLSETDINPSIITMFITLKSNNPLYAQELRDLWISKQINERHPRFQSIVDPTTQQHFVLIQRGLSDNSSSEVFDEANNTPGLSTSTTKSVQSHISETLFPWGGRRDLVERIKNLQMERWSLHDSLWHMYVAPWGPTGIIDPSSMGNDKNNGNNSDDAVNLTAKANADGGKIGDSVILFRAHHSLGDGASLGATFLELFDEADQIQQQIIDAVDEFRMKRKRKILTLWNRLLRLSMNLIHFMVSSFQAFGYYIYLHLMSAFIDADAWHHVRILHKKYDISKVSNLTNDDAERTISFVDVATVEQVKWIASELGGPSCTINDVFVTCLLGAIKKQLQYHRTRYDLLTKSEATRGSRKRVHIPEQSHMQIAMPVHLKGGVVLPGESLGNNLGAIVARLSSGEEATGSIMSSTPKDRLQAVSKELSYLKKLPIALYSHIGAKALSYVASIIPLSWASKLYNSSNVNSVAVISNNRSTPLPLHLNGRRVESFYGFVPLPPGIPIGLVVLSYNGKINCSLTAQRWAVPDADQFLFWFLEEYKVLLNFANGQTYENEQTNEQNRQLKLAR